MTETKLIEFEKVVQGCLNPDNAVRKQAEEVLKQLKTSNADLLLGFLTKLICESKDLNSRDFCAVMLRQYLSLANPLWNQASTQTQNYVKQALLELFKKEQNRKIRRKASEALGTLAAKIINKNGTWDEILPLLIEVSKSSHPLHRESVLDVFDKLAEYAIAFLRPHLKGIKQILCESLVDRQNSQVRVAALRATVTVVVSVEDEERKAFVDCVPIIFQSVGITQEQKDIEHLSDSCDQLLLLVRAQPTFLRQHLKNVVSFMVKIASNKELDNGVRRTALEFLVTLAETGGGMVRKLQEFSKSVVPLCMQFMMEIPNDLDQWNNDLMDKDKDEDEYQNFQMGLEVVDRVCKALGGKIFVSSSWGLIEQLISSSHWDQRHAALMTICEMAEGAYKELQPKLPKLTESIIPFMIQDQHPRVRWAAINVISQFSTDFKPDFQNKFIAQVLPALIKSLDPNNNPRVLVQAAMAVVDFVAGIEEDSTILEEYLDKLLESLLKLLNMKIPKVQEVSLMAVSGTALVAEQGFVKYYDHFMPGIKNILFNAKTAEYKELKGRAIECASALAKAVGYDVFSKDAKEVMAVLIDAQKVVTEKNEVVHANLVESFARICECMGSHFIPYLNYVLPPLFKSAQIENACVIMEGEEKTGLEEEEGYQSFVVTLRHVGNKRVTVNTVLLEEKAAACAMLYTYANQLVEGFFPFVDQTVKILVPLLSFTYHEGVRVSCISAMPALIKCAYFHFKKIAQLEQQGKAYVKGMFDFMLPTFLLSMKNEYVLESLHGILESFSECVTLLDIPLTSEQLQQTNEMLELLTSESKIRKQKREDLRNDADYDEEEKETIEGENDEEDELLGYIFLCVSKLVRNAGANYVPSFHKYLCPQFLPLLGAERKQGERVAALCIFDDVVLYGGEPAQVYIEKLLPVCLNDCKAEDVDTRQSAVFGIGCCAQSAGPAFAPFVQNALTALLQVINQEGSRDEDAASATDNAISSVGRIMNAVPNVLINNVSPNNPLHMSKLMPQWLSWLPISVDTEEAQFVHGLLCSFIESNNIYLLGPNNANLPKIVEIFAHILETDLIDAQTTARISKILAQIKSKLSPQQFKQLIDPLASDDKAKLNSLL